MTYLNNHRSADARRRNGIIGQTQRYLDTLGRWDTYRDINHIEEIPERIAQVTAAYVGLKGLAEGRLRLSSILGAMIALHALEQLTGGLATTGIRLSARGKPLASYRGITIRKSPFTPPRLTKPTCLAPGRPPAPHRRMARPDRTGSGGTGRAIQRSHPH